MLKKAFFDNNYTAVLAKRLYNTQAAVSVSSHDFKLKTFDEIKIGDIISSVDDCQLYRIFEKIRREQLYESDDKFMTRGYSIHSYIGGEKIVDLGTLNKYQLKIYGGTKRYKRLPDKIILESSDIYPSSFLVQDKNNLNKYFHIKKISPGDIIWHLCDKNHYKILDDVSPMDYGGHIVSGNYYNIIQLDSTKFLPKSNSITELYTENYALKYYKYFPVLNL